MKITVLAFASVQEALGVHQEQLDYIANETAAEAFTRWQQQYECEVNPAGIRVAINETFRPWDTPLNAGDEVAFIPPVAGG